jgi:hypothetical protein
MYKTKDIFSGDSNAFFSNMLVDLIKEARAKLRTVELEKPIGDPELKDLYDEYFSLLNECSIAFGKVYRLCYPFMRDHSLTFKWALEFVMRTSALLNLISGNIWNDQLPNVVDDIRTKIFRSSWPIIFVELKEDPTKTLKVIDLKENTTLTEIDWRERTDTGIGIIRRESECGKTISGGAVIVYFLPGSVENKTQNFDCFSVRFNTEEIHRYKLNLPVK